MHKIIKIGDGDLDRFIMVEDKNGYQFEVFDYSASTVKSMEDAFKLVVGNQYEMKFELHGNVLEEREKHKYGKIVNFEIIGIEKIGKYDFYIVKTDFGNFNIPKDYKSDNINCSTKTGIYNFTRIDIIQVDKMIHPEY